MLYIKNREINYDKKSNMKKIYISTTQSLYPAPDNKFLMNIRKMDHH